MSSKENNNDIDDRTEQIDTLDIGEHKKQPSSVTGDSWCLEMVRGPMVGEIVNLPIGTTSFGRAPERDVFLDDITVSRHHCEIETTNDTVTIIDMGSTNGTYVDSKAVDKAALEAGDVIQIGRFVFLLTRRSAT